MISNNDNEKFFELRSKYIENQFKHLNNMQREAVFCTNKHLLMLAGAGTGKTTTLINKINYILKFGEAYSNKKSTREITLQDLHDIENTLFTGVKPTESLKEVLSYNAPSAYRILAITFTNKAAKELKDRIARVSGVEASKQIQASTFHSFCAKVLRVEAKSTGFTQNFLIYDSEDSKKLVKDIIKEEYGGTTDVNIDLKTVRSYIEGKKNNRMRFIVKRDSDGSILKPDYEECSNNSKDMVKVYDYIGYLYNEKLKKLDAMDFEDLLVNMVILLENNKDILDKYSKRYKYIFVDEYQDTNKIQEQLISLLESYWNNLCVVGDDDQSIYAFRGASIENILTFENRYAETKVIKLTQNYRSTSNILNLANSVISKNTNRLGKDLWTEAQCGDYINLNEYYDDREEASAIIKEIKDEHLKIRDTAILYRFNYQSSALERELVKNNIPYRIIGGTKFYDRKEVKDIIAYLSLIVNSKDDVRLERIINVPARKIGKTTISKLKNIAKSSGMSLLQVCKNAEQYRELGTATKKVKAFYSLIESMALEVYNSNSPSNMIKVVLDETEYFKIYKDTVDEETRRQNIDQLIKNAMDFEADAKENGTDGSLQAFLENISLLSDMDRADFKQDAVTLMTMHSSKGLEYDNIFLIGWDATKFPSPKEDQDEEERRLAYVGITRAKKRLYISHCENSFVYGSMEYSGLSKFVYELDTNLCTGNLIEENPNHTEQLTDTPNINNTPNINGLNFGGTGVEPTDSLDEFKVGDRIYVETIGEVIVSRIESKGEIHLVFYNTDSGAGCFIREFCNIKRL